MTERDESIQRRIDALKRSIARRPGRVPPLVQLAELYREAGRRDEARRALEAALEIEPDNRYVRDQLEAFDTPGGPFSGGGARSAGVPVRRTRRKSRGFIIVMALLAAVILKFVVFPSTRKLAVNEANNYDPVWSPGGNYLGFYRVTGTLGKFQFPSQGAFFVADARGKNPRRWNPDGDAGGSYFDVAHRWSRDDSLVAFSRMAHGESLIIVANADGTHPVTVGPGELPRWSPAENLLAYLAYDTHRFFERQLSINIFNPSTGEIRTVVTRRAASFSWSSDGTHIVFDVHTWDSASFHNIDAFDPSSCENRSSNNLDNYFNISSDIYSVDIVSRDMQVLTRDGVSRDPLRVPGEDRIFFRKDLGSWKSGFYTMNSDGSGVQRLDTSGWRLVPGTRVALSPNGKWFAFEGVVSGTENPEEEEILSKDEKKPFSFMKLTDIFIGAVSDGRVHRLKNRHVGKKHPVFSSDSRWIAYHIKPLGTPAQIWMTRVH